VIRLRFDVSPDETVLRLFHTFVVICAGLLSPNMEDEEKAILRQPFTFGGLASYARAPGYWLAGSALLFAALLGSSAVWVAHRQWASVIDRAIAGLPAGAVVEDGRLAWPPRHPAGILAENRFLSLEVDLEGTPAGNQSDFHVVLGRGSVRLASLLGYCEIPYPRGWVISLNRAEAEPSWGAWKPACEAALGVFAGGSFLVVWAVLAAIYAHPARLLAFFCDRPLDFRGAWKLGVAAQFPGSLVLSGAVCLYGSARLDLTWLVAALLLHFAVAWLYVPGAVFGLRGPGSRPENPFAAPSVPKP